MPRVFRKKIYLVMKGNKIVDKFRHSRTAEDFITKQFLPKEYGVEIEFEEVI